MPTSTTAKAERTWIFILRESIEVSERIGIQCELLALRDSLYVLVSWGDTLLIQGYFCLPDLFATLK